MSESLIQFEDESYDSAEYYNEFKYSVGFLSAPKPRADFDIEDFYHTNDFNDFLIHFNEAKARYHEAKENFFVHCNTTRVAVLTIRIDDALLSTDEFKPIGDLAFL